MQAKKAAQAAAGRKKVRLHMHSTRQYQPLHVAMMYHHQPSDHTIIHLNSSRNLRRRSRLVWPPLTPLPMPPTARSNSNMPLQSQTQAHLPMKTSTPLKRLTLPPPTTPHQTPHERCGVPQQAQQKHLHPSAMPCRCVGLTTSCFVFTHTLSVGTFRRTPPAACRRHCATRCPAAAFTAARGRAAGGA